MAGPRSENRLISFPVPSFYILASVKIAVSLLQEFSFELLEETFSEIQAGNLATIQGTEKHRRAKKSLLDIPIDHLRQRVMKAVHGLCRAVDYWKGYYEYLIGLTEVEGSFLFRSDGTIDAVKSAQNLVRNVKLDIKKRFKVACVFALVESVESLWAEMVASGEVASLDTRQEDIVSFWVKWLKERPRVTSAKFIKSLGTLIPRNAHVFNDSQALLPRFSAIFPHLRPEDRVNCFDLLDRASLDDLRHCLYIITNEEEELVLRKVVSGVLRLHLTWPFQTLFLQVATKLGNYIDVNCFRMLLANILLLEDRWKDYNYSALFVMIWNMSPPPWRKNWEDWPYLKLGIDLFFERKYFSGVGQNN